ncbi:hypothetical protein BOTNAR_0682g00030 [Botryotinia narcissicola]|uniref:Uncharacterized protein n=1 Tax=Botryotinia narcissicola TaxID=278944 RepID=A0A4Z1HJU4_9HELO|nr:hypothetical protein BOTNAR_0682g00030 [Botryotinia narcissicola]
MLLTSEYEEQYFKNNSQIHRETEDTKPIRSTIVSRLQSNTKDVQPGHLPLPAPSHRRTIVVRRPPVKIFCQRCRDKWRLGGFYEIEATTSIARVDRALAGTEFRFTREEIQEGLRKADELFRREGF